MDENQIRAFILGSASSNIVRIENGQGGTPGLPDLLYFPNEKELPCIIGLELKSPKQKLSIAQRRIARKFAKNNTPYMFLRYNLSVKLFVLYVLKYPTVSGGYMWMSISFESLNLLHQSIIFLMHGKGNHEERI